MKKTIQLFTLCCSLAFGAGSVNQTITQLASKGVSSNYVIAMSWTGDASTGSVPATILSGGSSSTQQKLVADMIGYYFFTVETAPGSPAPTSGYTVKLVDPSGNDVLQGAAATVSNSVPQIFSIASSAPPLNGTFTLQITGQSVASAKGTVYVFMSQAPQISVTGGSASFTLTTTGSSGAATYTGGVLNIPVYSGGGSTAFSALTSGTNTTAAMVVGTGASIAPTGAGAITATIAPAGTLTGATLASNVLASSLTSVATLTGGATGSGFTIALTTSTVTGNLGVTHLNSGASASSSTFWRGDGIWASPTATISVPGSAITDAQCWASSSTLGVCADIKLTGSVSIGSSPPSLTAGTGGVDAWGEGTIPTVCRASAVDCLYADSTSHAILASFNNGAYYPLTRTIASGTSAMGTSAILSQACATVVTTSATGVLSTDAINVTPNASIKAVTGYTALTTGGLTIVGYPTADNVNWDACNWSSGTITPGAVTINWRVTR